MMLRSVFMGMACLVFVTPGLAEEAPIECSKIDDATARLSCYDSLFRPHLPPEVVATPPSAQESSSYDESVEEGFEDKELEKRDAKPRSFGEEQVKRGKSRPKQIDQPKINEITATIEKVYKRPMGEYAFEMTDGQIWHQQSVGYFKVMAGDTVVLIKHRAGGYSLRSPGGRSTRVRRVR